MKLLRLRSVPLLLIMFTMLMSMMALPIQASPERAEVQVQIRTINLNKEPMADVIVEVYNVTTDAEVFIEGGMTNQTGWVKFHLANDTYYSFKAFWKDVQVGSLPKQHITSSVTIDNFNCSLAYVKVVVKDEANVPLPYVNVALTYSYLTRYNETVSEGIPFETNETGTTAASNMFIDANYTIEARRYGFLFNRTLIPNLNQLLEGGWANLPIICPTGTLFIHAMDSGKLPLPGVQVEVYEWSGQILVRSGTTNEWGSVAFNCTFGRYKVKVSGYSVELKRRVVLNETVIDLIEIEDRSYLDIHCKIVNVAPSVKVVDYFGRPIPNAMIKIEQRIEEEWMEIKPARKTDSYGVASLPKIGGDYRVSVYVMEELCETRTLYLDETKAIVFKIDKYIGVSGYPLKTSQLTTYISLSLLAIVLGLALAYRRLSRIIIRKKAPS